MKHNRMTRNTLPEGFTLPLVIVDAVPVLLFCASAVALGVLLKSPLFVLGAAMVLFAGAAKVLWKAIVVLKRKNIWWMFLQMRILMPLGMLLMLTALLAGLYNANGMALWQAATAMPSAACFLTGLLGMALMIVFAFTLDSADVRFNWIEQITNGIAQAAILLGIVMML